MTYNVFGGTLNLAQLNSVNILEHSSEIFCQLHMGCLVFQQCMAALSTTGSAGGDFAFLLRSMVSGSQLLTFRVKWCEVIQF